MHLIYLINVDWFFDSHFAYLARRARAEGNQVTIVTHLTQASCKYDDLNIRVVPLPPARGGIVPEHLIRCISIVANELQNDASSILHAFGLFGIGVGTLASLKAGHRKRIFSITGRGYSAVSQNALASMVGVCSREFCRRLADGDSTYWLAENTADLEACGLERTVAEGRAAIVGGAGISLEDYPLIPMPPDPPVRFAIVSRMIWSKGIDTAVKAIGLARAKGADVTLTLAGGIDRENPKAWSDDEVRSLASVPGVQWLGRVENVVGLWADHHVAILASRGGEGVPRSLIEAAACGRPFITTDVPGCREFAKLCNGWIVAPDDPEGLMRAIVQASNPEVFKNIRHEDREARLEKFTEDSVWLSTKQSYLWASSVKSSRR